MQILQQNFSPKNSYIDKQNVPQQVEINENIIKICSGIDCCFSIDINQNVYGWGSNKNNKLGLDGSVNNENFQRTAKIISKISQKQIDQITSGLDHSFAWSSITGDVYSWGNGEFYKLGSGNNENLQEPTVLELIGQASQFGMKVCELCCGENHSLLILQIGEQNNKLFVWGNSKNWQLGLDGENIEYISVPHQIDPDPWNGNIVKIYASSNYSAALSKDGKAYTWGSGQFGRLGYYTETKQQKTPRLLKNLDGHKIVKLTLGIHHAAAVSDLGKLFTWGRGLNGQLGHGNILNQETPKQVQFFDQFIVIDISCGENHTLAMDQLGQVFSWGSDQFIFNYSQLPPKLYDNIFLAGQFGQLGLGDYKAQSFPQKLNHTQINKKAIQIACGHKHSLILTNDQKIYSFGSNEMGQLGINEKKFSKGQVQSTQKKPQNPNSELFPKITQSYEVKRSDLNFNLEKSNEKLLLSQSGNLSTFEQEKLILENEYLKKRIFDLEYIMNKNQSIDLQNRMIQNSQQILQNIDTIIFDKQIKMDTISMQTIQQNQLIDKQLENFQFQLQNHDQIEHYFKQFIIRYANLAKKQNYLLQNFQS